MANKKSFFGVAGVAALASLALSTAALADDDVNKFGYSISITGVSDYLFRGVSLTSGDPAFQPFVEFTYGKSDLTWYLDFWGSNVHDRDLYGVTGAGDPMEVDIYAGVRPVTGPVSWDIGVLYYTNPEAVRPGDTDYVEFKIAASVTPVTNLTLSVTGYATPDQKNYSQTETVEGLASYTLPKFAMFDPTFSAGVGYTTSSAADFFANGRDSYTYWNAGIKLAVDKYFMDFRYWDTDLTKSQMGGLNDAAARFVFSAGVNLP